MMVDFTKLIKQPAIGKCRKEIEIIGIRTNCFTNEERIVKITAYLKDGHHGKVFEISGGPTGYESLYLTPEMVKDFCENGIPWVACMGTKKSWDRLVIPNNQMIKAFDVLEIK